MKRLFLITAVVLFIAMNSCQKSSDYYYRDYLDNAEIAKSGKVDSLSIKPGKYRAKVSFIAPPDRRVKKVIINYRTNISDLVKEIEFELTEEDYGKIKEITLMNLPEATLIVSATCIITDDNISNIATAIGRVYGDKYESTLANRLFGELREDEEDEDDEVLYLDFLRESGLPRDQNLFIPMQYTEVIYPDFDGDSLRVTVTPYINTVTLQNIDYEGTFKFRTYYKPTENSIDSFYSKWTEVNID